MTLSPYSAENVRQGTVHYLFGRGVAGLAGFATVILLVRYMDVANYAGYTALSGLIMMSGIIAGLGLERAIARYVPEGQMHRSVQELGGLIWKTALIRLVASLMLALLIFSLWPQITEILDYVDLEEFPLPLVVFLVAENLFGHFSSVFQALMLQKMLTRLLVIQWAGRLLLIMAIVMDQSAVSLEASLWITAIPEFLGVLAFVVVLHRHLNQLSIRQADTMQTASSSWPSWKPVMSMALHNYGFSLLAAPPQGYFMRMLVAVTLPAEMVAAYGFFQSIAEKARQYVPLHFFHSMIEPLMIAHYLQDRDFSKLRNRCQLLYKSNLLLFVPAIAWVAAAGPDIVLALTGGKFGEQSWILLVILSQLLIGSHVVVLQLILNALGLSKILVKTSSYALFAMAAFLLIASQVNMLGIIYGPLVFSLTLNLLVVRNLGRLEHPYSPSWAMLRGTAIVGVLSWFAALLLLGPIERIGEIHTVAVASGLVVLLVYALGIYAFSVVDRIDISTIRSMIAKEAIDPQA